MLHTGRDAKDGQLQTQCYTQGVTLQTDSYRLNATQGVTLLQTEHLRRTTTDGQLQLQTQCYTGRNATTDGTLKTDNNRRTATATDSILHRA